MGGFLLLRVSSVAISVSLHVCFILSFNFDFYVSKLMHYELGIFHSKRKTKCLGYQGRTKGRGFVDRKLVDAPSNFFLPSQGDYSDLVLCMF